MAKLKVIVKDALGNAVKYDLVRVHGNDYATDENGNVVVDGLTIGDSVSVYSLRGSSYETITIDSPIVTLVKKYSGIVVRVYSSNGHRLFSVPVYIRYFDDAVDRYVTYECYSLLTDVSGVAGNYRLIRTGYML